MVKVSRIYDPGPRNFTTERSGAQLTSTMHRDIPAGSVRGAEIDRDPPPPILYFNLLKNTFKCSYSCSINTPLVLTRVRDFDKVVLLSKLSIYCDFILIFYIHCAVV